MKKPVYVVDAMNYIFRAYHSLPDNITSPKGMLTKFWDIFEPCCVSSKNVSRNI
jgi:hypothetical protein